MTLEGLVLKEISFVYISCSNMVANIVSSMLDINIGKF